MRIHRYLVTRSLLVAVPCTLLALFAGRAVASSQKDTPELLMQGAGESLAKSQSLTRGLAHVTQENNALLQHLQTDRSYAAAVLAAGQKNDRATLVSLMKQFSPGSDLSITQLNTDFTARIRKVTHTDAGDVITEICISTDHGCAGGGFLSITAK
jgi:hypothetical protein